MGHNQYFPPPFGELTLTPMDFSFIIGVRVGGKPIPWDLNIISRKTYILNMLGWIPSFASGRSVRMIDLQKMIKKRLLMSQIWYPLNNSPRIFILFFLCRALLCNIGDPIHLWCLLALEGVN